jgi:hypothetical protein
MKLTLSIIQRLKVLVLLNDFKGSYEDLSEVLKIVEKIKVREEEAKSIEMKTEENKITWKQDKEVPLEVDMTKDEKKILMTLLDKMDKDGKFGVEDKPLADVYEELKKI